MSGEKREHLARTLTTRSEVRYCLVNPMKWITRIALFTVAVSLNLFAAAPDVVGKWKWKYEPSNNEPIDVVLDLKQDGAKLSGSVQAADRDMKVQEGKISADGRVSFYVNLERDSGPLKIEFNGKLDGDKIVGKSGYTRDDGEKREGEWIAKREQKRDLTGKWNSVFKRQDGTPMETTLQLKQSGEKLTGTQSFNENESEIRDGKVQGDEVSFQIVRQRDDRTVTSKYKGKIQPNGSIKGEIESDWTGEVRKLEWEAQKAK